jgi:hypothetical protein
MIRLDASPAVITALDTFGKGFQEGMFLDIFDDFRCTMVYGPHAPADFALDNIFRKLFRMQIDLDVLGIFTDRAFHAKTPFRSMV